MAGAWLASGPWGCAGRADPGCSPERQFVRYNRALTISNCQRRLKIAHRNRAPAGSAGLVPACLPGMGLERRFVPRRNS